MENIPLFSFSSFRNSDFSSELNKWNVKKSGKIGGEGVNEKFWKTNR